MDKIIYGLCALTSASCAGLLLRAYARGRFKLLFWSFLCFAGLALTNLLLVLDRLVFTSVDLSSWRLGVALAAIVLLLYGLIFEKTS